VEWRCQAPPSVVGAEHGYPVGFLLHFGTGDILGDLDARFDRPRM